MSPAALGFSAQAITDCPIGGGDGGGGFTAEQIAAAAKQAGIRAALRLLTPAHQAVLEACYELRTWSLQESSDWGIAVGAVTRAKHACVDAESAAKHGYDHARRQRRAAVRAEDVAFWDGERKRTRALLSEQERASNRAAEDTVVLVERAHRCYLAIRKRHRAEEREDKARRLQDAQGAQVVELEQRRRAKCARGLGSKVKERVLWVADMMRDIMRLGGGMAA